MATHWHSDKSHHLYKETPVHFSSHHLQWDSSSLELSCLCVALLWMEGLHSPDGLPESDHCTLRLQILCDSGGQNRISKPMSEGARILEGRGKQNYKFRPPAQDNYPNRVLMGTSARFLELKTRLERNTCPPAHTSTLIHMHTSLNCSSGLNLSETHLVVFVFTA